MEEEDLLIFQSGKIEVQLPINDSNIDALIMILENLKINIKEDKETFEDQFKKFKNKEEKPKVFKKKIARGRTPKYPEEMKDFCERHMNQSSNQQLSELVNEKFGLNTTPAKIGNYLWLRKLKRVNPNRQRVERKEEKIESGNYHPEPKKQGHPIKYTQEVVDYIKDNYANTTRNKLIQQVNNMFGLDLNLDRFKGLLASKGINKQSCKENKNPGVEPNEAFDNDPDIDDLELDD